MYVISDFSLCLTRFCVHLGISFSRYFRFFNVSLHSGTLQTSRTASKKLRLDRKVCVKRAAVRQLPTPSEGGEWAGPRGTHALR